MLISVRSVPAGCANACMSRADEVARDTLAQSHQYPVHRNSEGVQATTASLLMLIGNGSVSLVNTVTALRD